MSAHVELSPEEKTLGIELLEVPDGREIVFIVQVRAEADHMPVEAVADQFNDAIYDMARTVKRHKVAERWAEKLQEASATSSVASGVEVRVVPVGREEGVITMPPWESLKGDAFEVPSAREILLAAKLAVESGHVSVDELESRFKDVFRRMLAGVRRHKVAERWVKKLKNGAA